MDNNYLRHYGVRGMKWGVIRSANHHSITKQKKKYDKYDRELDRINYGKRGQRRIEKRIEKGNSKTVARGKEFIMQQTIGTAASLALVDYMLDGSLHRRAGQAFVNSYMKSKVAKSVIKIPTKDKTIRKKVDYKIY